MAALGLPTGGERSIRQRLAAAILATCLAALVLVSGSFVTLELLRMRKDMPEQLSVLGDLVAQTGKVALAFEDPTPAREALAALAVEEHVLAAAIYRRDGTEFARWTAEGTAGEVIPAGPESPGHDFGSDHIDVWRPVSLDGELLGTIFVRSDNQRWNQRLVEYGVAVAAVLLLTCAFGWLVASRLRAQIASPLGEVVDGAAALAEGDLSVRVRAEGDDEIGRLGRAFNGMTESLRELVMRVRDDGLQVKEAAAGLEEASRTMRSQTARQEEAVEASRESVQKVNSSIDQVNEAAESLADTAQETSSSVTQMDASISEIAAHMDRLSGTIDGTASSVAELSAAIGQISESSSSLGEATESTTRSLRDLKGSAGQVGEHARECHDEAQRSSAEAERGMASVSETVDGMHAIRDAMGSLQEVIGGLSEKSQSIGDVVRVIGEVVSRTNLLALNASIIASQAGEHGRAFSVVAREVQQLAETTASSTQEIESIVQSVRGDVSKAVEAVTTTAGRVETGVGLASEAGNVLRDIREASSRVSQKVGLIVDAAGNQVTDLGRLDGDMVRVAEIVEHIVSATQEQSRASADITRSVESVRELGQEVMRSTREQTKQSRVLTGAVEDVASRTAQVASATKEQQEGGARISQALEVFRESVEQGARHAELIQSTVESLAARSKALESEIGRFRV